MNAPANMPPAPGQPSGQAPRDYIVTFVTNPSIGDVHVFVADGLDLNIVQDIAKNFG